MALFDFKWTDTSLEKALEELPQRAATAVKKTIRETTQRAVKIAKFKTPVDSGAAIRGWKVSFEDGGLRGVFRNDVPYINVLEFGGYPVRKATAGASPGTLRRGGAILGGLPAGRRTQRAPGGAPPMRSNVTRQAPRGMVRVTLLEIEPQFVADLNESLDEALNRSA